MSKEKLKPCPCGGKMELLNTQRHLKQRVSREMFELVCATCGLTVSHPSKSTHKLIGRWNTPPYSPASDLQQAHDKAVNALNDLYCEQNGPPLIKNKFSWQAAYDRAGLIIDDNMEMLMENE